MNLLPSRQAKPVTGPTTTPEDPSTVGYVIAVIARDSRRVLHLTDTDLRTYPSALAEVEKWQDGIPTPNRRYAVCKVTVVVE